MLKAVAYFTDRLCGLVVRVPWLHIQGPGFLSRLYQVFWEVVVLELGPLSLVSTSKELLGRKISDSGLEVRDYDCGDPPHWLRDNPPSEKAGTNFADKRRSLGRYSSLATQATEFVCLLISQRYFSVSNTVINFLFFFISCKFTI
jgi:hypothetical protein